MTRRTLAALAFLVAPLALPADSQEVYRSASVASRWLNLPASARLAGMGGAYVARGAEPGSLQVNPAGMAGMNGWQALLTHNSWVEGMSLERLAGAMNFPCLGTVGATLDYLDLGLVEKVEIDSAGDPRTTGYAHPSSTALGLAFAVDRGALALGGALKGLFENEVSGWAAGAQLDLGAHFAFDSGARAGASVQNLGLDFGGTLRPTSLRLGGGYTVRGRLPLALDMDADWQANDAEPPVLRAGAEWAAWKQIILRLGYVAGNDRAPTGPTLGLGWLAGMVELDYAFYAAGELGFSHLVTLRFVPLGL